MTLVMKAELSLLRIIQACRTEWTRAETIVRDNVIFHIQQLIVAVPCKAAYIEELPLIQLP